MAGLAAMPPAHLPRWPPVGTALTPKPPGPAAPDIQYDHDNQDATNIPSDDYLSHDHDNKGRENIHSNDHNIQKIETQH